MRLPAKWQLFGAAGLLRLLFLLLTPFPASVQDRIEVSNRQVGITWVREAIYLLARGVPIYQNGTACQPSPLVVSVVGLAGRAGAEALLFVLLDMLAALLVWRVAELLQRRLQRQAGRKRAGVEYDPFWLAALYLFHPFALLACAAKSSAVFSTVACLAAFYFALRQQRRLAMLMLGLATLLSLYPCTLVVPLVLLLREAPAGPARCSVATAVRSYLACLVGWCALAWWVAAIPAPVGPEALRRAADFVLHATPVGCNVLVADLRPNLGLAWYMFVEMFDHYRPFYLAVFQLNLFIYVVPASLKFAADPMVLAAVLAAVGGLFKPYPTVADSLLILVLLAFTGGSLLRRSVVLPLYVFAMLACGLLGPINWHYWIQQGSGNANFYYAHVLAYNTSHILLVLDVVYQWVLADVERRNPGTPLDGVYLA